MKTILSFLALAGTITNGLAFPGYDPFADATGSGGSQYLAGSDLWKQTNAMGDIWFGANTGNAGGRVVLTNFSLSYPGLPASAGNCVRFRNVNGGPGARIFVSTNVNEFFGTTTNTTLYYSLILQVPDISALSATGEYFIGFNNQATVGDQSNQPGIQAARLYLKKVGSEYQIGIAKNTAVVDYATNLFLVTDTVFVVAGYEIVYNESNIVTTDDNARLWLNPAASTFGAQQPPVHNAAILGAETDINTYVSSLVLLNRTASAPSVTLADDVRMGRTWAFVTGGPEIAVPPPSELNPAFSSTFNLSTLAKSGGPSALSYRWQKNGMNLADGGNISGAATASLTVSAAAGTDGGGYAVVVSNSMGAVTSRISTVTVVDPAITTQPTNQIVAPGATAHFNVAAVGTPILKYRWQRDGTALSDGGNISGASTPNLNIAGVSAPDVAAYSCYVTNGVGGIALSSNAMLTLLDPGITAQPQNVTNNYGATASFSVTAVGAAPLSYRWQKDGVNLTNGPSASGAIISGATTSNLTITGVAYLDAGNYAAFATNGIGASVGSDPAYLAVNDPYIITQPVNHTNAPGTTVNFFVTANGTPPLSYAWYKNDAPLSDGGNISGATTTTLIISNITIADPGSYRVIVSGGSSIQLSSITAVLALNSTPGRPLYWDSNGNAPGSGGSGGTWGTDYFWSSDTNGEGITGAWLDGSAAVFSAGTDAGGAFSVTVTQVQAAAGLTFEEGAVTLTSGTLNMVNAGGQSTISVADTVSGTISSVIAGTNDIVKTGPGFLRLNANNTHTGRTIIKAGTVSVQADSRWGAVPLSPRADEITLDGGTLECNATGNPGQQNNGNRGILITTNNGTIAETAANGTGALTVFGVVSGPGKLIKIGGSVLRLENSNTFSGGTDLNEGKIYANASGALGTGVVTIGTNAGMILRTAPGTGGATVTLSNNIVLTGGTLALGPATGTGANLELRGTISGAGAILKSVGDREFTIWGANTFSGGFTLAADHVGIGNKTALGTGAITIGDSAAAPTGTLYFEPAVDLTGANAITNAVNVYAQFSLSLRTNNNMEFSGPIELGNSFAGGLIPIFANGPALTHTFSGVISSAVGNGFIKDGVGALVLKGANTYPGGTTVANGALIVNNTSGSGTGPGAVTVNSTGMLMGNGTVAGAVSVSGGAIAAGASVGKLTLQNGLDMSSGGTNAWELGSLKDNGTGTAGTDFDQIAITSGSLNLAGSSVLTLNFLGATAPNAANAFWQAPHVWTIVKLSGGATNSGGTAFTIPNPTNSAGTFSNSVVADGIVLTFTPSSVPRPMIQNISGNTTSATISWNANSGVNYQVQYNTNLSTTNWLVLSNVSGASGPVSIADNHGVEPQRFYRLVITP